MMRQLLALVLIAFIIAALPTWSYSRQWGYYPSSMVGFLLVLFLLFILLGYA